MLHRLSAVLLLAAAVSVFPSTAHAAVCSGTSGVTVIVQFPDGHIRTGCAPGDPSTGTQALKNAGFDWSPVPGQQGTTVCQIDNQPATGEQCWQPPDYWAYFYAKRGGSWTYSSYGAGNRDPKPGTVDGWKFGGSQDDPPSMRPPGKVASTPTATPTTAPRPTVRASNPVVKPVTSGHAASGTGSSAPDATTSARVSGTPSVPSATDDPGAPASDPGATDTVAGPDVAARTPAKSSGSGNRSWIWGVLLVGALGTAAGVTAARRRRG